MPKTPNSTNNPILPGSHKEAPHAAVIQTMPHMGEQVNLTIKLRRSKPLPEVIDEPLNRSRFDWYHGASIEDMESVADWCMDNGLAIKSENLASRTLKVSGTMDAATAAFSANVSIFKSTITGQTFRARTGPITVPDHLKGIIVGIFGFDQRHQAKPHFRLRQPEGIGARVMAAAKPASLTPFQVAQAYGFPAATGAGECIGIIELGGGYKQSDIEAYFPGLGLPVPNVISIAVDGAVNQPTGNPNSADGEVALDIQVAGAVAPSAKIAVYFAPNTSQGFLDAITEATHDTVNKPSVISISWGGPEDSYDQQTLDAMNAALQDAVALGVTVCVASGDSGSTDGEPGRHVDFPGSSPYALCCGGTSLRLNVDGSIESEVVWNDGPQGGESGGGESKVWPRPSYQNSVSTSGWRGVPDVAGNADPDTGYDVIIDGQKGVIGGTSAVAPLWAGLIARISQLQGKPSGFINPTIYPLQATAFNDILLGGNGRYHAKKGWDQCTGLGSPKGGVLVKAL